MVKKTKPRKGVMAGNDNAPGRRVGHGGAVLSHSAKYSKTGVAIQPAGGIPTFVGSDRTSINPANKNARPTRRTKKKK